MDAIDPFIQAPVPTIDRTMATSPNDAPSLVCHPSSRQRDATTDRQQRDDGRDGMGAAPIPYSL